jgi:hypothetical protein
MNRKQLPRSGESLIDRRPLGEPMSSVRLRRPKRAASFTLPCERSTELRTESSPCLGIYVASAGTTFGRVWMICSIVLLWLVSPNPSSAAPADPEVGERSVR